MENLADAENHMVMWILIGFLVFIIIALAISTARDTDKRIKTARKHLEWLDDRDTELKDKDYS